MKQRPTQNNDGTWRIKTNEELEILIKKKRNIARFIKSRRLRWAAHVIRIDTIRTVKKLSEWEPCSSRPVGRPRLRWLEQVEEDLQLRGCITKRSTDSTKQGTSAQQYNVIIT